MWQFVDALMCALWFALRVGFCELRACGACCDLSVLCTSPAGGVLADLIFNWHRFTHHLWTAVAIIVVGAIYILLGFLPYIDNFGHLFGMATGFFLTTCLLRTFPVGSGISGEHA